MYATYFPRVSNRARAVMLVLAFQSNLARTLFQSGQACCYGETD
jgi:hypothetical protein